MSDARRRTAIKSKKFEEFYARIIQYLDVINPSGARGAIRYKFGRSRSDTPNKLAELVGAGTDYFARTLETVQEYARGFTNSTGRHEQSDKMSKFWLSSYYLILKDSGNLDAFLSLLESYSTAGDEATSDAPPEEQSADAPLGKWAFPRARRGAVPPEEDTREEEMLYRDLAMFFSNNKKISDASVDLLKKIASDGMYGKVFHTSTAAEVYRGMSDDGSLMQKIAAHEGADIDLTQDYGYIPVSSYVVRPRKNIASWTTKGGVAATFASTGAGGKEFSVVLVADPAENERSFITGPGGLYDVDGFDAWTEEAEVICVGEVTLKGVYWSRTRARLKANTWFPAAKTS